MDARDQGGEPNTSEKRLVEGVQALTVINRLAVDRQFNETLGRALEAGDAAALGKIMAGSGIESVSMTQSGGRTSLNFQLGLSVCVQVTLTICF